ncbi:MAG: helix-turn-helix domain-containing protein [Alphaproteobacteria bacterium]|nr:helix-turn-helix domain-containing protein [Alphaproteobacteria bacterium]MBU0798632.1 helix-turn-helix domain-containing protein [Alphaproteobacteria bacterium]MBU0887008.1 helix-turn-helix domain-containing protein [Alphaproteobacteria bacterium]MBU1811884.1 helix-turn-helix domain-containing protein [Alphaproteobacteria bacterium]
MAEPARPFTPESLAEYWSCSSQHVRDLIRKGDLPAFRIGNLIRIRREDVERYDQQQAEARERAAPQGALDVSQRPYTPETLAERWGCSHQHIRDLVRTGKLPAFRVGRLIRVRREDVETFERPQVEIEAAAPPPPPRPAVIPGVPKRRRHIVKLADGREIDLNRD